MKRVHLPRVKSAQRGLTLLELLLTLLIFSLVMGVFSQALVQVARFERSFAAGTVLWQQSRITGLAAADMVQGVRLQGTRGDDGAKGQALRWESDAYAPLPGLTGVPLRMTLELRQVAGDAKAWSLWAVYQTDAASIKPAPSAVGLASLGGPGMELARWEQPVRFEYVDARGQASEVWPTLGRADEGFLQTELLPRTIRVVSERGQLMHAWQLRGAVQRVELTRNPAAAMAAQAGSLGTGSAFSN